MHLLRLIEPIVDVGVPTHEHHPERVRRLRVVSTGTLLLLVVGTPFALQYWQAGVPQLALAVLAAMVAAVANLVVLRHTGRAPLCGNVATAILFLVLALTSFGSGGFYEPGFGWLYVVPLAGFVMVGLRSGLSWTGVTLVATLAFWLLPRMGIPVTDLLPPEQHAAQSLANRLAAVGAIAVLAMAFVASQRVTLRTLKQANEAAQAASRAKSDFLAAMSHEIRTPMTSILGYADVLGEEHELTPEQRCALSIIKRNGEHLLQIINDVLDLSKIEAGRLDVERTRFSAVDVMREVESLMWVRADAKGLALEVEFDGEIPATILGDPLRMQQVLINLISNAIKFTEEGSVTIAMRQIFTETGTNLEIEVIDTGIGLSEQGREELFAAFAQAQVSTARRFGGTGLGLAICARLCELMRAAIDVRSEKGKGSTFRLTLFDVEPMGVADLERQGRPYDRAGRGPQASYTDCRILLAEDSLDNQRLIEHILQRAGAVVTVAENGRIAVDQALAALDGGAPFDVILMDMQMPELDGYEATRELRRSGYTGAIIALTAHAMSHLRARCFDAGCDDFATKPLDRPKLFAALDRQLAARKSTLRS